MADSTLDSEIITLAYGLWGPPRPDYAEPAGDITAAAIHNISAATTLYPVGTVVALYNSAAGVAGWSEFTFLKYEGTGAPTSAIKQVCVQDAAGTPTTVTNDPDSNLAISTSRIAITISAMTDAYFGWFWTGGVCPEEYVSGLGGNYKTDGTVVIGSMMAVDLTADEIGLALVTGVNLVIGYSDAADA